MTRVIALFAAAAVLIGLGVGWFIALRGGSSDELAECRRSTVAGGTAQIGGPFTLMAADGARVTEADVITGPTLVYFGYSFCPDFCPTDLARNALVSDMLEEEGVSVGQVFITIDPERDTPEVMGEYAEILHPELVALSGTPEEIDAAAQAYRVYYRRAGDDPEYYLMDHSTYTYLVEPEHGFLEFFSSSASPEEMTEAIGCYASRI